MKGGVQIMSELVVNKVSHKKNFTVIDNTILRDKNTSLKAKAFLCYILCLPSDWDFSREGILTCIKEGKTALNTVLKELEKNGYLKITNSTRAGKYYSKYEFYEIPYRKYLCRSLKPKRKLQSRKSVTEKTTQINTNKISTKSNKSNKVIYRSDKSPIDEIKNQISYSMLVKKYDEYDINKIIMVISKVITSDKEDEYTRNIFNSLTLYHIEYVLKKAKSNSKKIINYDAWLKKVLCSIPPETIPTNRESDFTNFVPSEDGW
jgi:hypothetical protein